MKTLRNSSTTWLLLLPLLGSCTTDPEVVVPTADTRDLLVRDQLSTATRDEDEVSKLRDEAISAKKSDEEIGRWSAKLKDLIPRTDALVHNVFTPEVIERTPWTDLLSGAQKQAWQQAGFQGWRIDDKGVLVARMPDVDTQVSGIMTVGDLTPWRDYVFECEFALIRSEAVFHFRLGSAIDNSTVNVRFSTTGAAALEAGRNYVMTVRLIGSAFQLVLADGKGDFEEPNLSWDVRRKGAIGISMPPGSEIRITRMRIKILR
jgi:hypothetical protein